MSGIRKAFILGAGLGTRLRPLTESLPKPLVPVWNRPLITYALDHLIADLGIEEFAINTHHCPDAYGVAFPGSVYRERPLLFRHEPILLDTAGGIDNLRDWLPRDESFLVYNGDILTDLPLAAAVAQHRASGDLVTMILRSRGDELRVGFDPERQAVVDLRGVLAPDWPLRFQFTGIYVVSPEFLDHLVPGKIESVVLPMLEVIRKGGRIGGIVIDEGEWSDLGERDSYLASLPLLAGGFPRYLGAGEGNSRIAASARIDPTAEIDELSSVGAGAVIGAGTRLRESVIWPGAIVEAGADLRRVVVRDGLTVSGRHEKVDF
jgi:mannose-1-phosphate guanylyltransferase/mannose-1-phosphate guanylyltransferase/phosphomannomutase